MAAAATPPTATPPTAPEVRGRWRRAGARMLAALALATTLGLAPQAAAPAQASVVGSCSVSGCSAARTARTGWSSLGFPTSAGWYAWPYGQYNYTGGRFHNYEGQLPSATYNEYDVYPRARGAARDAHRIVVDRSTGATWYTPDHYTDFYRIA